MAHIQRLFVSLTPRSTEPHSSQHANETTSPSDYNFTKHGLFFTVITNVKVENSLDVGVFGVCNILQCFNVAILLYNTHIFIYFK